MLEDVCEGLTGVGKAVDSDNPISPAQMPRGYGGVAVLWASSIDHCVRPLDDCGNRIQCIEILTDSRKYLIASVYMPSKGNSDMLDDFREILDQLHEIVLKYRPTHKVVIGGDFNEHMDKKNSCRRMSALREFLGEHAMSVTQTGNTFVHSNGRDSTTIDYFLHQDGLILDTHVIDDLASNTSDHYPVIVSIKGEITHCAQKDSISKSRKTPWSKIDIDFFKAVVAEAVPSIDIVPGENFSIDKAVNDVNELLSKASQISTSARVTTAKRRKTNNLTVWSKDIATAIRKSRQCHWEWKNCGRPSDPLNALLLARKVARNELRRHIRIATAEKLLQDRAEIMEARMNDTRRLYKLINRHRGRLGGFVDELHVEEITFSGTDMLQGWKKHFSGLAQPSDNSQFHQPYAEQVQRDVDIIYDICKEGSPEVTFTRKQVSEAIDSLNKNKAEDIYGLATEHLQNAGEGILDLITMIVNSIMHSGHVPASLKEGYITPVYKNKGSKFEAKNYRGITVTPIITKVLEALLLTVIKPFVTEIQNPLQRGFTTHASPLMAATILEEVLRDSKDDRCETYTAYLDAKSAFDVVDHNSLLRKLFLAGVEGKPWTVIHALHSKTRSCVKWKGQMSDSFQIVQGVRQGGLLSTELYKVYVNDLLDRLQNTRLGVRIGTTDCSAPTCADDVTLLARNPQSLQTLLDVAVNYSNRERYLLQPTKSVVLVVQSSRHKQPQMQTFQIGNNPVSIVENTTHLGIQRDTTSTAAATVDANIQKARRTMYSLMRPGLHGENGLDPVTSLHLISIYVLPILLYGLEICLPKGNQLKRLDVFLKKILKQILSLPVNTADSAVYILSGVLPVSPQIHYRALTHFGSIARLPSTSVERNIAYRQLLTKDQSSASWFLEIRNIANTYNLADPLEVLDSPPSAGQWKRQVKLAINSHWKNVIIEKARDYSSLRHLNVDIFTPGSHHPLLETRPGNPRDVTRLHTKLLLATGTYILQSSRKAFNQNKVQATCLLCGVGDETKEHFLLHCVSLQVARHSNLEKITQIALRLLGPSVNLHDYSMAQLIIDSSRIPEINHNKELIEIMNYHARCLCYALHIRRYQLLGIAKPRRKR